MYLFVSDENKFNICYLRALNEVFLDIQVCNIHGKNPFTHNNAALAGIEISNLDNRHHLKPLLFLVCKLVLRLID